MTDISKYWKCKDGTLIKISEMSNSHLLNSLKMIERAHEMNVLAVAACPPDFQGEMAQLAADQEFNAIIESEPEDLFPEYKYLQTEAVNRGLV